MIETYLQVVHIMMNLDSPDRDSAIDQMAYLASRNNQVDLTDLQTCLKEREHTRSTGFGKGVAIPHAFSKKLPHIVISLAILKNPIDWSAIDKKPVQIVAMVAGPNAAMGAYMKVLLRISKVLADDSTRANILKQPNCQGIFDVIKRYDRELNY